MRGAHLYLRVPPLQKGDPQQDALLEHLVVLGVDDEIDDQLCRTDAVQEALDLHHVAARLIRVQHGRTSNKDNQDLKYTSTEKVHRSTMFENTIRYLFFLFL